MKRGKEVSSREKMSTIFPKQSARPFLRDVKLEKLTIAMLIEKITSLEWKLALCRKYYCVCNNYLVALSFSVYSS